jgi:histidinol-phosphate aminotransferase
MSDPSRFLLPHISRMKGYVPGEQPKQGEFLKLNTNENPYAPSPRVLERLRQACDERLRRYPDPDASGVKSRLSKLFGLPVESILVGNGSDELLNLAIRCFVGRAKRVVIPHPTYPYYEKLVQLQDGLLVKVNFEEDFTLPREFIDASASMTIIANPNSPSGTLVSNEMIEAVATGTEGVVILDEAYIDFSDVGGLQLLERFPNLIVMRTMSKSFSLAAMRIGYCFAQPPVIAGLAKAKEHYNIGLLAQIAAEAALDDLQYMKDNAERVKKVRTDLSSELRRLGFEVWDSAANFVLARIERPKAADIYGELKRRHVLVRYFDDPRLRDCLRISVGTDEEIAVLIEHLDEIIEKG